MLLSNRCILIILIDLITKFVQRIDLPDRGWNLNGSPGLHPFALSLSYQDDQFFEHSHRPDILPVMMCIIENILSSSCNFSQIYVPQQKRNLSCDCYSVTCVTCNDKISLKNWSLLTEILTRVFWFTLHYNLKFTIVKEELIGNTDYT